MACFFSSASSVLINNSKIGRDEVYVAAVPLRATKGPAQLFMSTAYSLNFSWDLQHFMVVIKPSSPPDQQHQAVVYDFQPEDPENIFVAAAALSGRKVTGVILVRKIGKLPKRKCWFVGYSDKSAAEAANKFNENWETNLRIGYHDCRNYTEADSNSIDLSEGLVECLTGEKSVLKCLRENEDFCFHQNQINV